MSHRAYPKRRIRAPGHGRKAFPIKHVGFNGAIKVLDPTALSNEEFLEAEGLEDRECRVCGGKLKEAERKNTNNRGIELPRFYCPDCGEIYEQIGDYYQGEDYEE